MVRRGVREYLRLRPASREEIAQEVDEEIALHIDLRVQELVGLGMDPDEARKEAEKRFGEVGRARLDLQRTAEDRERRMSAAEWLAGWRQDFAYSARALSREPLIAVVIVVTLALGIGANATIFGIIDQLLLRGPAHVEAPEQVKRVYVTLTGFTGEVTTSAITGYVTSTILRENTDHFAEVAVYSHSTQRIGGGYDAPEVAVGWATSELFPLLGVRPALGRFFTASETQPGASERVAVLEYGLWQSEFGGLNSALGQSVVLNDREYTIIGVAPPGFTGAEFTPTRVWLPGVAGFEPTDDWTTTWNARWVRVITRLRDGVSVEQADAAATALMRAAAAEAQARGAAELRVSLLPPTFTLAGLEPPEFAVSRWLAGVSLIVLLVACANVVNLLIARGLRRRRELAVRLALGVSRTRLARLLMSESLLLAGAGGVLALFVVTAGSRFIRAALFPELLWDSPLNNRVLLFSAVVVLVTGLVVGPLPAVQATRHTLTDALKSGSVRTGAQRTWVRGGLTVLQTAFALVLLVGAALFVQSLRNVHALDLGIQPDRVLSAWLEYQSMGPMPQAERQAERVRQAASRREVMFRLRQRNDIAATTLAAGSPLQGTMSQSLRVPGWDSLPKLPGGGPYAIGVDDGYFATVGTRILRGRAIEDADITHGDHVAVVNDVMARTLWPGEDALGKCLQIRSADAPCSRVVGIAQEARRAQLVEEPAMQYYIPLGQGGLSGGVLLVRPVDRPSAFIPELRTALRSLEPALGSIDINLLSHALDPHIRPWRLGATMFTVFGVLALIIAAIGLFSVIAYGVTQRKAELAVRVALGAGSGRIVGLIMREGIRLVVLGIVFGFPLALLAGRQIEGLLFEMSAADPLTFAAVAAVLLAVAALASLLPAARAGRTNPLRVMRGD